VNALNIALVLAEDAGNNEIGLEVIYAAQNAMIAVAERYHRTQRLVFAGDELRDLNAGIALFENMVETVTKRQYTRAAAETVNRKNRGDVVRIKKDGQTKRFELKEAA
jgi:RES domain-containing protein